MAAGAAGAGFVGRIQASGPFGWALLALVVVAAVLLVVADLSEISYRTIGIGACVDRAGTGVCTTTGHESHAWALTILAPFALVMGWGAVVGRSRAAAFALGAVGIGVLVIALAIDQPKLSDKRGLDTLYDDVVGHTGTAFKLELAAGVLLILTAGLVLAWPDGLGRRRKKPAAAAEVGEAGSDAPSAEAAEDERQRRRRERAERRAAAKSEPPEAEAEAEPPAAEAPAAAEPEPAKADAPAADDELADRSGPS